MLKKISYPFMIIWVVLFITACNDNSSPQIGKHYTLLDNDLTSLNLDPITEVFSLTCGHCWNMEKSIPEIESKTNNKVGKVHVTFNKNAQTSALLYYAAVMQLDTTPSHQLVDQLFSAVQAKTDTVAQQKQIIENVFISNKLASPYDFDSKQGTKLAEHMRLATTVTNQANINSVPSFIIKGKYLLLNEGHQDIDDLAKTINYLLSQPE
ncbi:thioredoxin domain-containing protein [Vibrio sp. TH_r3]|uniref:thioredoxin domain-containing protein n=1 Tax=Vibrio sp. TH_r3 TaxID=3082084 RepID=UPI002952EBE8|nr:thioredoxin domain-containing protein [Vibrio sp. TH_r3]MDV7103456.1 thioredoxin domain-containing protein [Vibrio sp. TH_r3]